MEEDVLEHVFEPFYSTKEEGTGLGLATVYGIVKQTGGQVTIYSDPGVGTTVRVYLPRAGEEEADPAGPPRPSRSAAEGGERMLLVEDSEAVRGVAERMLRVLGYSVVTAATAEEAPDLRVLSTSGHADPGLVELEELERMGGFLEKPFSPAELGEAVRSALEEEGVGDEESSGEETEEG